MRLIRIILWSTLTPIVLFLALIAVLIIYLMTGQAPATEVDFGVSFSQPFAEKLGLDWQETYSAILSDLGVKKLRLVAYWPEIEPSPGEYVFDDLDWQIEQAERNNAEIILAIGRKLPRWPECHIPDWAKQLPEQHQQRRILSLLLEIVKHYQGNKTIKFWQVENEPFLRGFGECPPLDKNFLDQEIALVSKLDKRPIILTTSGELSLWFGPASRTEILGTTLYRDVWSRLGRIRYPLTPVFYYKRAQLIKWLTGVEKVLVIELQAEPWSQKQIYETPFEEQMRSMDFDKFKNIVSFMKQTGLSQAYFWGAEWWYWLKTEEGDDSIWQEAKRIVNSE